MTRCRYCNNEFPKYHARHETLCPRNPNQAARRHAFMHEWAENGYALSRGMYTDFSADYKAEHHESLPGPMEIERAYGSWQAFAHACGLAYSPAHYHPQRKAQGLDPCVMPGSIMADDSFWFDASALRCEPVVREVREWHPRAHAWVTVGAQEWLQVK